MSQSIQSLYKNTVLSLRKLYSEQEARAMSDRLFECYFNLTPARRVISGTMPADVGKITSIDKAITELLNQVPLQYVLGKAYFMDMDFVVNSSVLIPRPETEELVSLVLKEFSAKKYDGKPQILDIGTGSGCIAIALKHKIPYSDLTAVDISQDALNVAIANAAMNNEDINFIRADILDHTKWDLIPECDLIVSNPPYVTQSEKQFMLPNVLDYEPHTALFVPDEDPLVFYRVILEFAKNKLRTDGSLWFEINEMYGNELRNMALIQGFREVNIIFDIQGKSRFLQCLK